jgi:hypothetical protein
MCEYVNIGSWVPQGMAEARAVAVPQGMAEARAVAVGGLDLARHSSVRALLHW